MMPAKKIDLIEKLNNSQFIDAFDKILADLNNGKKMTTEINDTLNILDKSSELTLSEAYLAYSYFIQNAIKRYDSFPKNKAVFLAIFNATIENSKLIAILSSDNTRKVQSLHNNMSVISTNPVITPGNREIAIHYIRNWILNNVTESMIIIDPYFNEDELTLLKLIQEAAPNCSVKILTSKKSQNNNHIDVETKKSINKEIYSNKWKQISSDIPITTTIKVVWDRETCECPFHDRWFIDGSFTKGLIIGTSFNGLGNRDAQIIELDSNALSNVKNEVIDRYLFQEVSRCGKYNLKYERFDLEE